MEQLLEGRMRLKVRDSARGDVSADVFGSQQEL